MRWTQPQGGGENEYTIKSGEYSSSEVTAYGGGGSLDILANNAQSSLQNVTNLRVSTFLRLGNGRNTSAKVSLKQFTLYSISPSLSLKWSACIKHTSAK